MLKKFLLFFLLILWPAAALAATEITGDGVDNDSTGGDFLYDDCDRDNDGFLAAGSGCLNNYYNNGSAQVDGIQSSVTELTVDAGHTIKPGQLIDAATDRYVLAVTATTVLLDGTVSASDNAAVNLVSQWDADDTKRGIYPGQTTSSGCSAGDYRTALVDGSFSSCSAISGYTCHSGSGSTYYFDPAETDCSGSGSYADPENYLCVSDTGMSGYHAPVAGDCYVFRLGHHDDTWSSGAKQFEITSKDGSLSSWIKITAQPGDSFWDRGYGNGAIIDGVAASDAPPIDILLSSHYSISNLEVTTTTGHSTVGIRFREDNYVKIESNAVHGIRGTAANNLSGIGVSNDAMYVLARNNILWDNFDSASPTNSDISALRIIDGGHFAFLHNAGLNQVGETAYSCIKLKHDGAGTFGNQIVGNECENFWGPGISLGGFPNVTVKGNILTDTNTGNSAGALNWVAGDGAGTDDYSNAEIAYNTFIRSDFFGVSSAGIACSNLGSPFANIHHNVISDNRATTYPTDGTDGFWRIMTSGDGTTYSCMEDGRLTIDNNCYYNSASTRLDFIYFPSGGGALYQGLAALQAKAGRQYDDNTVNENPNLSSGRRAQSTNCADKGARLAGDASSSTTTTTTVPPTQDMGGMAVYYQ